MWPSVFVLCTFSWAAQYPMYMYWQIAWHLTFVHPVYFALIEQSVQRLERDVINET